MRIVVRPVGLDPGRFQVRPRPVEAPPPPSRYKLTAQLERLEDELVDFRNVLRSARLQRGGTTAAGVAFVDSIALGLSTTGTAATLSSHTEVNTTPTSYSSRTPAWTGGSTRSIAVTGTYDGSQGDDTLTATVDLGPLGTGFPTRIFIRDGAGNEIDRLTVTGLTPGETFAMTNGLELTFGAGDFENGDTFTIDVSTSVGTSLDPTKAFNGAGTEAAQLDAGFTINDGSFDLNGVTIAVNAGDSLNDVLDRIDNSAAGVTASYDSVADRVTITGNTAGSDSEVRLENDSSGFVAALKLDGLGPVRGEAADVDKPLSDLAQFAVVTAGTVTVNGTIIALDPSTDTVNTLLVALGSANGVNARLLPNGQIRLESKAGGSLTVDDGGTQLFDALGIEERTYVAAEATTGGGRRLSQVTARKIAAETEDVREALDAILDHGVTAGLTGRLHGELTQLVEEALDGEAGVNRYADLAGLDTFTNDSVASTSRLAREVRQSYRDIQDLWLGERRRDGLIDGLRSVIDDAQAQLRRDGSLLL